MESSERVRFVFPGKQGEVEAQLTHSAIERIFLGQRIYLDPELIDQQSLGLAEGEGVHLAVIGEKAKKDQTWVVPSDKQMSSNNGS